MYSELERRHHKPPMTSPSRFSAILLPSLTSSTSSTRPVFPTGPPAVCHPLFPCQQFRSEGQSQGFGLQLAYLCRSGGTTEPINIAMQSGAEDMTDSTRGHCSQDKCTCRATNIPHLSLASSPSLAPLSHLLRNGCPEPDTTMNGKSQFFHLLSIFDVATSSSL